MLNMFSPSSFLVTTARVAAYHAENKPSLARRKIARVLMQDGGQSKSMDESSRFRSARVRQNVFPSLHTAAKRGHCPWA